MQNRLEGLVSVFSKLHHKSVDDERITETQSDVTIEEIISLLEAGNFLSANINETQLFKSKSKNELIDCVVTLYARFKKVQNPYDQIIVALLLSRIFGFFLPNKQDLISIGTVPYNVVKAIEDQQFDLALQLLHHSILNPEDVYESVLKGIGMAFHGRAFQLLEQQVQSSIAKRKPDLFREFDIDKYALQVPPKFQNVVDVVRIPVRIELAACVGSDIFLLSMTRPEKARVINISVDLFNEKTKQFESPIHCIARPIEEKGIRITSIDLGCSKLITSIDDLFNMRNDDLSLLKAAVIASGIIPPSVKNLTDSDLASIVKKFVSNIPEANGFEILTSVIQIPRGSGLAVSTNLLAGMITSLMRFSGQFNNDLITESQKQEIAVRAIYAEWLGGSGGGWQDYGGLWGGFKEIKGIQSNGFDEHSIGGLLPAFEEMHLSDEVVSHIMNSMVLINGGTGQDVGPILKMIALQFATKNDVAWSARLETENRYPLIREALCNGDAKQLGKLEGEDFINRVQVSPLANNLYHEMIAKRMTEVFGEDLWGYDSTGGRAGAGGVFWIHPDKKDAFEKYFLEVGKDVQYELRGQMHFASAPLVYKFALNKIGVSVAPMDKHEANSLINLWKDNRITSQERNIGDDQIQMIKEIYGYNEKLFGKLQKDYKKGELSLASNTYASIDRIDPALKGDRLHKIPFPGSREYEQLHIDGLKYFREPIAYITLNGGESTRYGSNVIRSLNPSIYIDGKYRSPLELKMANIKFVRDRYGAKILPVFTNGYFTEKNTKRVLRSNQYYGIPNQDIFNCSHEVIHRVIPTIKDLDFWFDRIREKPISAREEVLAEQYHKTMQLWIKEKGEGEIYTAPGKNKVNTLVSPGHFYSFMALVVNGVLGELIKKGVRHLIVSSNDNLTATIDPAILAFHVNRNNAVTSEVVPRLFDRGGAPVMVDGKIQIFEDFRFPDAETLWKAPYFNPITSWIKVDAIMNLLGLDEMDLIKSSDKNRSAAMKCREAVENLADKLATYPVLKHLQEDMGNGISYMFPVIQFEKLFGDLISKLNPEFLLVPKLMRHTQIKSVDHIYQVYNDHSLDVLKSQIILNTQLQEIVKEGEVWA